MFLVEEQFWNLMEILGGIKMIVENKCLGTQMKTSGVDFNGKHYKSNASLAKAFNIPLQTFLSRRYALHWSLEQCVRHDIKSRRAPFKRPPVTKYMWGWNDDVKAYVAPNGTCYSTIRRMCFDYQMTRGTISSRLKRGYTLAEAMSAPKALGRTEIDDTYGYDETAKCYKLEMADTFSSVKAMCKAYNMPIAWFRICCEQGKTKEYIRTHIPELKDQYVVNGAIGSASDVCKENGISVGSVWLQAIRNDISFEKAAIMVICNKPKSNKHREEKYGYNKAEHAFVGKDENLFKSFAGMCQFYKVEANTVARRVNVGVPISMALDDSGTHYFACA